MDGNRQMNYQSFLIADYREGLRLDVDPWLLPSQAFTKFENAELDKGVVRKRKGYKKLVEYSRLRASITNISLPSGTPVVITTMSPHGLSNDDRVTFKGVTTTDINGKEYTVASATTNTFALAGTDGDDFSAGSGGYVYFFAEDAIVGIMNYTASTGEKETLVADTDTIGVYDQGANQFQGLYDEVASISAVTQANPGVVTTSANHGLANGQYVYIDSVVGMTELNGHLFRVANQTATTFELEGVDTSGFTAYSSGGTVYLVDNLFSGSSNDFFQFNNYQNKLWMTNGIDRLITYDGTNIDKPTIGIASAGTNAVSRLKIVKSQKSRVQLLNTVESSVNYFQRARTSAFGSTTDWIDSDSGGQGAYEDASTADQIVSAQLLYDNLIVQFDGSTWLYRYTGNAFQPFRWELIDSTFKNGARMGTEQFDRYVISVGVTGIIVCDGSRVQRIDQKIPDFMERLDISDIPNMFMKRFKLNDKVWTTYKNNDSGTARDKVLEYNYKDGSWAIHDLTFNVFGEYLKANDTETWATISETWAQATRVWNDEQFQADYPTPIAGDTNGIIWELFQTGQDGLIENADGTVTEGAAYTMTLGTKQLNPYAEANRNADIYAVSFLFSEDEGQTVTVQYFQDYQDTPTYIDGQPSISFSLTPPYNTAKRFWKKIVINSEAAFHRFEITNSEKNAIPEVHAMLIEARPGGILERYA